ncbi:MAG: hypothetical protein KDK74_13755 [Cephaloticoccus sp.]|nr:hypothetical protein [Cephaloticoccus sp.]
MSATVARGGNSTAISSVAAAGATSGAIAGANASGQDSQSLGQAAADGATQGAVQGAAESGATVDVVQEAAEAAAEAGQEVVDNETPVVETPVEQPTLLSANLNLSYGTFVIEWFADGSTVTVRRVGAGTTDGSNNEITIANLGQMTAAQRAALESALAAAAAAANQGDVVVEVPGSGNVIVVSPS